MAGRKAMNVSMKKLIRTRSKLRAVVVISLLGVGLAGCSWKPDADPPCDESQRQQLRIASLPGCAPLVRKTYNYDF
jgi:hypothetical protein